MSLGPYQAKRNFTLSREPRGHKRQRNAENGARTIYFLEWTQDGSLRQPVFLGLRDDKPASKVSRN